MTEQEYIMQNELGFEGDTFFRAKMESIIKEHDIDTIIETGTYRGSTTKAMAAMAEHIITIESNRDFFKIATEKLKDLDNVTQIFGSSAAQLPMACELAEGRTLFFLDAHWGDNNPLLQELGIIASLGLKPIIIIHDFMVPGRPDLGWDEYGQGSNRIVYNWDYIKADIGAIYGADRFRYEYNTQATGAKRGIIFIYPVS